jgi:hypothetical protein
MNLEFILQKYPDQTLLKADGFDDAIIGIDISSMRLIYSIAQCIDILMENMSYEDAKEYFYYNISGCYVGEQTPIYCDDID